MNNNETINYDELNWDALFNLDIMPESSDEHERNMSMVMSMFQDDIAEVSSISTLDLEPMSLREVAYILERTRETLERIRMEVDCYLLDAISRKAEREYKELNHE